MLFQDFWPSRAKIFTSPPSPSLLISNFWIAFDVQTFFLIFTYSTVTDPLPGDLIIEDIDLEQKMCQIFHFEAKNWDKNLGFSQFLSHSIDYPNYRMRQNWGKPEILPEFLTGFRVTLSWHVLAACKMHSRVKVVSLIKCYLWLNIW